MQNGVLVHYLLDELLAPWLGNQPCPALTIKSLSNDSRTVQKDALFFAYKTDLCDRVDYISDVIAKGVTTIAIDANRADAPCIQADYPGIVFLVIPDLANCYGAIAARFYGDPTQSLEVIGVTGTNGKSSTAYFIAQALTALGKPCGFAGTFGVGMLNKLKPSALTTLDPISLQAYAAAMKAQGAQALAIEMSSHALDQNRLQGVCVNTVVLTQITSDHLDYHKTMPAYIAAKEKCLSLPGVQHAVLNCDDAIGRIWAEKYHQMLSVVGYASHIDHLKSLPFIKNTIVLDNVVHHDMGMTITMMLNKKLITIESSLIGTFNVMNLMAATGVLLAQGYDHDAIAQALQTVHGAPGRMERFGGDQQPTIYIDFAHTTDGLIKALEVTKAHTRGKLIVVFGCGGDRDTTKRAPMGYAAAQFADRVIVSNDNPRSENPQSIAEVVLQGVAAQGFNMTEAAIILNRKQAIQDAIHHANKGDCVLIAGKGHETTQVFADHTEHCDDRTIVKNYLKECAAC